MKKLTMTLILSAVLLACTNAGQIQYNTDRLNRIEPYMRENKLLKPSENADKLLEEGVIEYSQPYDSGGN